MMHKTSILQFLHSSNFSKPPLPSEPPQRHRCANHTGNDGDRETHLPPFHTVDEVHAEHGRDESREKDDHVQRRQKPHHRIHIIINNVRVGVHRRVKDVDVDGGGLTRLVHLDVHILNEFGIQFIDRQTELQLAQQ